MITEEEILDKSVYVNESHDRYLCVWLGTRIELVFSIKIKSQMDKITHPFDFL